MSFDRTAGPRLRILLALVGVPMIAGGIGVVALAASNDVPAGLSFEFLLPFAAGVLLVVAGILSLRPRLHPAFILMTLDLVGLAVAGYLSAVELRNQLPYCGVLHGCQQVAQSEYARIGGIPVAVFGVFLSIALFTLALAWWRTGSNTLLAGHYFLSLIGVLFEGYFSYVEAFLVGAWCIWCITYGISLVLRFVVALIVWVNRPRVVYEDEAFG